MSDYLTESDSNIESTSTSSLSEASAETQSDVNSSLNWDTTSAAEPSSIEGQADNQEFQASLSQDAADWND